MDALKKARILDANLKYLGYQTIQLMEAAGLGVANTISVKGKSIGVLCGLGNNGGDGFVAARYLCESNKVTVYLLGEEEDIKTKEAAENFSLLSNCPVKIIEVPDSNSVSEIKRHDIYVDAMLGVGVWNTPKEPFKSTIAKVNKTKTKKISIDIPSGYGTKIEFKANMIISVSENKINNKILNKVISIGVPKDVEEILGPGNVKYLSKRDAESHKGDNGRVLVIGGSDEYHGAVVFSALAASKFADIVYVATVEENFQVVKGFSPEFIVLDLKDFDFEELKKFDSILIGPGFAVSKENETFLNDLLKACKKTNKKIVIDASAIRMLNPKMLYANCVLTPHKDEFKGLFKLEFSKENILKKARENKCMILGKGPEDYVSDGNFVFLNQSGNAGMTTGGTGDALAGVILGLSAKNDLLDACLGGVFLTGFAGDEFQEVPFNATDLIGKLRYAFEKCVNY
jgi:ADP-dependent NAD(P)H-hydrate dehydratase / NAD(P)H-hydrate epimerase